jgi:hypothetical protein
MLAVQTVHTTGINVASLATILGGFAAIVAIMQTFLSRRIQRKDAAHDKEIQDIRSDITTSVDHLSEVLLARLETKQAVSEINARLSRVEGAIAAKDKSA